MAHYTSTAAQTRPHVAALDLSSARLHQQQQAPLPTPPSFNTSPTSYTASSRARPTFANGNGTGTGGSASSRAGTFSPSTYDARTPSSPQKYNHAALPTTNGASSPQKGWALSDPGAAGQRVFDPTRNHGDATDVGTQLPPPPPSKSPATPTSATRAKRSNPLEDLILTETLFVADLGCIIKRVAGAWSRSNFPPPALDTMFRAVEAVYRINKAMLARLNEIGPNPSSPKALGDLLMRWITDLTPAYSRFSSTYQVDFDSYEPVQSNEKLAPILDSLEWPGTLPSPAEPRTPSLDDLFSLPVYRIAYYKKLYTKLLKSTQEGRSDHALLVDANRTLEQLGRACEDGKNRSVVLMSGGTLPLRVNVEPAPAQSPAPATASSSPGPGPPPRLQALPPLPPVPSFAAEQDSIPSPVEEQRGGSSTGGSRSEERSSGESRRLDSSASSFRSSGDTATSATNTSAATHRGLTRVEDLEHRLSTDRVLDIFTMQPKRCKLQMAPPNLPFVRQLRRAADVSISFVPTCDPSQREIVTRNAHIILLTDLFLICQYMTFEERAAAAASNSDGSGPDMWLMYPPLSGKHLQVIDGGRKGEIEVVIMKRERLSVQVGDALAAREWRAAFEEAVAFGAAQPARSSSVSSTPNTPSDTTHFAVPSLPRGPSPVAHQQQPWSAQPSPLAGNLPFSDNTARTQSPHDFDYRSNAEANMGYGAPPSRQLPQLQTDPARRAFSAGPSSQQQAALPPRNHIMYPNSANGAASSSSTSLRTSGPPCPLPPAPAYPRSDDGRGISPLPNDRHFSSRSGYSDGRYSPHQNQGGRYSPHQSSTDFGGPQFQQSNGYRQPQQYQQPFDNPPPMPDTVSRHHKLSSRSNGSLSSTAAWTDRSSFPELPPIPGHRFGAGSNHDLNGGGYASSVRTAPSRTGSNMLSPGGSIYRSRSSEGLRQGSHYRLPSAMLQEERANSAPGSTRGRAEYDDAHDDDSPPTSPVDSRPEQTSVVAQMRCKIFLQQSPGQWKNLGTGKLKLFMSVPSRRKQIVVDTDKNKTIISTIVLADGTERVGKTGVAIELTDDGSRTGIVYMLQMKTEQAAKGLFDQLLLGSSRAARAAP